jgi:O-antigen/teichoic acid export membrane protein
LTRMLTPEEFGFIGLMQVMLFILVPVFGFQSFSLIGISKVQKTSSDYKKFRNSYLNFSILIAFLLIFPAMFIVSNYYEKYYILFVLTYAIAGLKYFIQFHNQELIQDGQASIYGRLNLLTQVFSLVLTLVFLSITQLSWEGRLLAILLADLFITIIRLVYLSNIVTNYKLHMQHVDIKEVLHFGAPLFIALGASWVTFESDKFIVNHFFSLELVGKYTVAYIIGASLNTVNQSVRNVYVPMIRKQLALGKGRKLMKKFQLYYGAIVLFIASFISILFYFFDGYILGEQYLGIWKIISIVLFAYAFYGIYSAYGAIFDFYKLSMLRTKFTVLAALVNLMISFSLLPFIGYLAPAAGTLGSFIIILFVSYKYAIRELDQRRIL